MSGITHDFGVGDPLSIEIAALADEPHWYVPDQFRARLPVTSSEVVDVGREPGTAYTAILRSGQIHALSFFYPTGRDDVVRGPAPVLGVRESQHTRERGPVGDVYAATEGVRLGDGGWADAGWFAMLAVEAAPDA